MALHKCKDHRTGIIYVYEVEKNVDAKTGQPVTKRHMIGRLDEQGNVVPTSGRRGRLPKKNSEKKEDFQAEYLKREIQSLKEKNAALESMISELEQEKLLLVNGMRELIGRVKIS